MLQEIKNSLLEWFGNALSLIVLIYLIVSVVNTTCFDFTQSIIAVIALLITVLIHLYTSLNKKL